MTSAGKRIGGVPPRIRVAYTLLILAGLVASARCGSARKSGPTVTGSAGSHSDGGLAGHGGGGMGGGGTGGDGAMDGGGRAGGAAGSAADASTPCTTGDKRCSPGTSNTPQMCNSAGVWQDQPICTAAAPTCNNGGCICLGVVCGGACSVTSTDVANCGGCGRPCQTANVTTRTCAGSLCMASCTAGHADCNHPVAPAADDGCECVGTACCGTSCQTVHTDGLVADMLMAPSFGQAFYDCSTTIDQAAAMDACKTFTAHSPPPRNRSTLQWLACQNIASGFVCATASYDGVACPSGGLVWGCDGYCWGYAGAAAGKVYASTGNYVCLSNNQPPTCTAPTATVTPMPVLGQWM